MENSISDPRLNRTSIAFDSIGIYRDFEIRFTQVLIQTSHVVRWVKLLHVVVCVIDNLRSRELPVLNVDRNEAVEESE